MVSISIFFHFKLSAAYVILYLVCRSGIGREIHKNGSKVLLCLRQWGHVREDLEGGRERERAMWSVLQYMLHSPHHMGIYKPPLHTPYWSICLTKSLKCILKIVIEIFLPWTTSHTVLNRWINRLKYSVPSFPVEYRLMQIFYVDDVGE